MSKSKEIGTWTETAVRKWLVSLGFSELEAHRNVLSGSLDRGDVWLRLPIGLVVFEVKGGHAAENASINQAFAWMGEAERECHNAGGIRSILVTKRKAVGEKRAGEWWAYVLIQNQLTDDETMFRATLAEVISYLGFTHAAA